MSELGISNNKLNIKAQIDQQTTITNNAKIWSDDCASVFSEYNVEMQDATEDFDINNINLRDAEQNLLSIDEKVKNYASELDKTTNSLSEYKNLMLNAKDQKTKDKLNEQIKTLASQTEKQKADLEAAIKEQELSTEARNKAIDAYDYANVVLTEVGANYNKASTDNDSAYKDYYNETEKLKQLQTKADSLPRSEGLDMLSKEYGTNVEDFLNNATGGYNLGKSDEEDKKFFTALQNHIIKNGGLNANEHYADTTEYDNSKKPTDETNKTSCAIGIASMLDDDPRCANLTLGEKVALVVCSQDDIVKNTKTGNLDNTGIGKKDLDKSWNFVNSYDTQKTENTLNEKKSQVKQFEDIFKEVKNKQNTTNDSDVITPETINDVYNKLKQVQKENECNITSIQKNTNGLKTIKYSDGTQLSFKEGEEIKISKYLEDSYEYTAMINTTEEKGKHHDQLISSVYKITSSKSTDSTFAFDYKDDNKNPLTTNVDVTNLNGKHKINIFTNSNRLK